MNSTLKYSKFQKMIIAAVFCIIMTIAFLPQFGLVNKAEATTNINLGDYVQMGTYYGEPILWRCVAFYKVDSNGNVDLNDTSTTCKEGYLPLMLSDKILCLKAFDAAGSNTSGSHGRGGTYDGKKGYYRQQYGSNYWGDSNIRTWLNSSSVSGKVYWKCGNSPNENNVMSSYNDYNTDAGFLSNFSSIEKNCMKPVCQDNILDRYEFDSMNYYGSSYHTYNTAIGDCVSNLASAYKESFKDTFFLLDVKQLNDVWTNRGKLGQDYYIGKPSSQCISNSDYKNSSLNINNVWSNWLRTPVANGINYGSQVRCVSDDGSISNSKAYRGNYGIRPAFYLNPDTTVFEYGSGTSGNPYKVSTGGTLGYNDSLTWSYNEFTKTLYIQGNGEMPYCSKYPWDSLRDEVESLIILDGVTSVNSSAFRHFKKLKSISLPSTLKSLDSECFYGCPINDVRLSKNVEYIGNNSFWGAKKFTVDLENPYYKSSSDGVLFSNDMKTLIAFPTGSSATSYSIPSGVEEIKTHAFYCSNLQSVYFNEGLKLIGADSFEECDNLSNISFRNGELEIEVGAFSYCHKLDNVALPSGLRKIGNYAFYFCTALKNITFPNGLKEIGEYAFACCDIRQLSLKSGLESIKFRAFSQNSEMNSILLPSGIKCIEEQAFVDTGYYSSSSNWKDGMLYINEYLIDVDTGKYGDVSIKNGTTAIACSAFKDCSKITSISVPTEIEKIPAGCFMNCNKLENIVVNGNISDIGRYSFYNCSSLKDIQISEGVSQIGDYAFSGCSSLNKVIIPKSVEAIGYSAFAGTINVSRIEYNPINCICEINPYENSVVFNGAGAATDGIELIVSDSVEIIPTYLFSSNGFGGYSNKPNISTISLGNKVKNIKQGAFGGITTFSSITLPAGIETIEENAFAGCAGLKDVFFNGNAPETASSAFGDDSQMSKTTIHYGTAFATLFNTVYWNKFKKAESLTSGKCGENSSWYLNDGALTLTGTGKTYDFAEGESPWFESYGDSITDVYIYGISSIGDYAFFDLDNLKSVHIDSTVKSIGDFAFSGCDGLEEVQVPNSVNMIDNFAFYECKGLKKAVCGSGVNSIGVGAFMNCPALENIYFLGEYPSLGKKCLTGSNQSMKVHYPEDLSSWNSKTIESYTMEPMTVSSISVEQLPAKRDYQKGSALDTEGMKLCVVYDTGDENISFTASIKSGFNTSYDFNTVGTSSVSVNYKGKTTSFELDVIEPTVESISIKRLPDITEYEVGEDLNTDGIILSVKYSNGQVKEISEGFTTEYHFYSEGKSLVTVTYEEKNTTFEVEVFDTSLTGIEITSKPEKLTYEIGEELSTEGLVLKGLYSNGLSETINSDDYEISYDFSKPGKTNVVIEYEGYTDSFEVEVNGSDWPVVTVNAGSASAGKTLSVNVDLEANSNSIGAYTLYLLYDTDVLTFKSINNAGEGTYRSNYIKNSKLLGQKIVYMGESTITEDGTLFTLTFDVNNDADTSEIDIDLEYDKASTTDIQGNELSLFINNGKAKILSYVPGDANGDGSVTTADVVLIIRSFANLEIIAENQKIALDMNGDGQLTLADAVLILKSLL